MVSWVDLNYIIKECYVLLNKPDDVTIINYYIIILN